MGACTGGGVYSPAIMDFIVQVKGTAQMFITGPRVIKEVTGEEITFEDLGGHSVHTGKSGVAHFAAENDLQCCQLIRQLLSYLPQNNREKPPDVDGEDDPERSNDVLTEIVPAEPRKTYDMGRVIRELMDIDSFLEVQASFAKSMIIGFGRLSGKVVGVVANQPKHLGGTIDIDAADKAARFIRFCDCFSIPLIVLADVPGYLPGSEQERRGIIRAWGQNALCVFRGHGAQDYHCFEKVLRVALFPAMCCHETGADILLAWPTAEFAMLGSQAAVPILYGKGNRGGR